MNPNNKPKHIKEVLQSYFSPQMMAAIESFVKEKVKEALAEKEDDPLNAYEGEYLTATQISRAYKISTQTIRNRRKAGIIRAERVGKKFVYTKEEARKLLIKPELIINRRMIHQ